MPRPTLIDFETPVSTLAYSAARDEVVAWSLDPHQGALQGPLDLGFFRGRTLQLDLRTDQVALITEGSRLSRLLPAGRHLLPVGTGPGSIAPDQHLIFLDQSENLQFAWSRSDPLVRDSGAGRSLMGDCEVAIADPRTFFTTFLAGNECIDPAFVGRLVDQLLRTSLPRVLTCALAGSTSPDFVALQNRLLDLEPQILEQDLGPCGLACVRLSLYAPGNGHPIGEEGPSETETAGQRDDLRHN